MKKLIGMEQYFFFFLCIKVKHVMKSLNFFRKNTYVIFWRTFANELIFLHINYFSVDIHNIFLQQEIKLIKPINRVIR